MHLRACVCVRVCKSVRLPAHHTHRARLDRHTALAPIHLRPEGNARAWVCAFEFPGHHHEGGKGRGCVRAVRRPEGNARAWVCACEVQAHHHEGGKGRVCGQRQKSKATVNFCTSLRTAPTVSSGVLVRSTDTKLRHENRETHAGMAIFAKRDRQTDRQTTLEPLTIVIRPNATPSMTWHGLFTKSRGGCIKTYAQTHTSS